MQPVDHLAESRSGEVAAGADLRRQAQPVLPDAVPPVRGLDVAVPLVERGDVGSGHGGTLPRVPMAAAAGPHRGSGRRHPGARAGCGGGAPGANPAGRTAGGATRLAGMPPGPLTGPTPSRPSSLRPGMTRAPRPTFTWSSAGRTCADQAGVVARSAGGTGGPRSAPQSAPRGRGAS
ncbi:MAG: hypothetical protein AVDCRST_MAG48-3293 [uncultured Friedmanniella sp.]|uniref:Uncharacterized protein n=1 Tax=uncultured Friedmanniella sp. TaxID=335381 RepID=A0A6J4LKM3_9ACTN|nr:MAG: hypothetical protein AVDCRST_MAG48-3293 [uncultured Friedmanniella sp.]